MPYDVRKTKRGYEIIRKADGKVVARPNTIIGVKGYIWHAEHADRSKKNG